MILTKKNVCEEFGALLKRRITESNSTMTALGRTVGVNRTTISDYTRGKYIPKEEVFHRIHQVFPDKELYDAYFKAVRTHEPRPNKNLIPEVKTYNFYKAKSDNAISESPTRDLSKAESATLNNKYIMYSLKHTLTYMTKEGLDKLCPIDFEIYESIYKEMWDKFKND